MEEQLEAYLRPQKGHKDNFYVSSRKLSGKRSQIC